MKKTICLLLACLLLFCITGCAAEKANGSSDAKVRNPIGTVGENNLNESNAAGNIPDEPIEDGDAYMSALKAAYEEAVALYEQDSELYRYPGSFQTETAEMVQLEDGQWYQSFVYTTYNCRCVYLSKNEYDAGEKWAFVPIGSAENAFLYNAGVVYDDPSGEAPYVERRVAVRGLLSGATDGYAYTLELPDELIVCIKGESGESLLTETETLLLSSDAAALLDGKQGEIALTGVVMQDENGNLYLNEADLLNS